MYFRHSTEIWRQYPSLAAGVISIDGITTTVGVEARTARFSDIARQRLANSTESEFPEIQAWRRAFSTMGLKPTQYRCASESLLRRFRKEGELPRIHPLIDLCNAISLAYATPIAVIDSDQIAENLEVRHASGDEGYLTFGGEIEHPELGEVVFVDAIGQAHARRWTNRQSGRSAIRPETTSALIVAEALHESAAADIASLVQALTEELTAIWKQPEATALLTGEAPRFEF